MLFHPFSSQTERREYGGFDFIELQCCKLKRGTSIKKIISVDHIEHWKTDSLYLSGDDMENFLFLYSDIFNQGIYNNGKSGLVDLFGINYYPPKLEEAIIKRLRERNSEDDRILTDWLMTADGHNGLYILGV
ncbi:MAG: hypothetical protein ACI3XL_00475 [Eubacteriales bacterium]